MMNKIIKYDLFFIENGYTSKIHSFKMKIV